MRNLTILTALSTLLVLPVPAKAQEVPRSGETVDVSIVNVDAVVTDSRGHRVEGLKSEDFEIRENRKLQSISNLAEYGGAENQAEGRPKRVVIVFVDRFVLPEKKATPMFDALRNVLRRSVQDGDAVTIVSWDRILVRRLPFTDDPSAIDSTIAAIEKESVFESGYFLSAAQRTRGFLEKTTASASRPGYRANFDDVDLRETTDETRVEYRAKYKAVQSLIDSVSGVEARKILIMLTNSLPRTVRYLRHDDYSLEIQSVVRAANANGVTIYSYYPVGLSPQTASSEWGVCYGDVSDQMSVRSELADRTGGRSDWDASSIARTLPEIAVDVDQYYSLAYRASSRGDDRERDIVVRTKNPAYRIRSRRSYVDKSDRRRMNERVVANLVQPTGRPDSTLSLDARAGAARPSGKNRWLVPLSIQIPAGDLFSEPSASGNAGSFSVFIASGSAVGEISDVTERTQKYTIPTDKLRSQNGETFTYDFELLTDGRTDRVSVGVLDDVSHGYGLTSVDLPPPGRTDRP